MKGSYRRVLDCLKSGGSIWYPANSRTAYLCLGDQVRKCHVSTLREMDNQGYIELENKGEVGSDTYAELPKP